MEILNLNSKSGGIPLIYLEGKYQILPDYSLVIHIYFRSEYQRFFWSTNKEPLTYYDMNLSAQGNDIFLGIYKSSLYFNFFLH